MNRLLKSIIFLLVTWLTACHVQRGQSHNSPSSNTTVYTLSDDKAFVPTDNNQFYFPLEVLRDTSSYVGQDTFVDTWYSHQLFAMREPIIYTDKTQSEIFRFTWLRTFHNPIAIRIEKHGDTYNLFWKLSNGAGGYQPGQLTINKQKVIDKATWDTFQNRLNQIDFWNMKTSERTFGSDGSQWILEGKTQNQYHVVDRWTPDEENKYYQCCDFLIGLTGLKINKRDKY